MNRKKFHCDVSDPDSVRNESRYLNSHFFETFFFDVLNKFISPRSFCKSIHNLCVAYVCCTEIRAGFVHRETKQKKTRNVEMRELLSRLFSPIITCHEHLFIHIFSLSLH